MFLVMVMNKTVEVSAMGHIQKLDLTYIKGMKGAMPVFENRKDAEEYANGHQVVEIEYNLHGI
jgi:hypothetical protein